MLQRLRSLVGDGWRRLRAAVLGREGATDRSGASGPVGPLDVRPEELDSKADILVETGLTPQEFVLRLLEENGGRLKQQEIVDFTGWAEATVSRMLDAMEQRGYVERVQFGQEKVVYLPTVAPEVEDRSNSAGADGRRG